MKTLKEQVEALRWWHCIRLSPEVITKGDSGHSSDNINQIEKRFGLTQELVNGKTVLDVGTWDGLFAFEAEKRGAKEVTAIDPGQNFGSYGGKKCFELARETLNSKVQYYSWDLASIHGKTCLNFDVVLFYGVLYHLEEPLTAIKQLSALTKEVAVIETAISSIKDKSVFEFIPGNEKDHTNMFYPNYEGLKNALLWAGFKRVDHIHTFSNRITVKAYK